MSHKNGSVTTNKGKEYKHSQTCPTTFSDNIWGRKNSNSSHYIHSWSITTQSPISNFLSFFLSFTTTTSMNSPQILVFQIIFTPNLVFHLPFKGNVVKKKNFLKNYTTYYAHNQQVVSEMSQRSCSPLNIVWSKLHPWPIGSSPVSCLRNEACSSQVEDILDLFPVSSFWGKFL